MQFHSEYNWREFGLPGEHLYHGKPARLGFRNRILHRAVALLGPAGYLHAALWFDIPCWNYDGYLHKHGKLYLHSDSQRLVVRDQLSTE